MLFQKKILQTNYTASKKTAPRIHNNSRTPAELIEKKNAAIATIG